MPKRKTAFCLRAVLTLPCCYYDQHYLICCCYRYKGLFFLFTFSFFFQVLSFLLSFWIWSAYFFFLCFFQFAATNCFLSMIQKNRKGTQVGVYGCGGAAVSQHVHRSLLGGTFMRISGSCVSTPACILKCQHLHAGFLI